MNDDDFDSSIQYCVPSKSPLVPTGVPFIDKMLGGGQIQDGVYGLLGPFGSCKTTTGVMLAVEAARRMELDEGKAAGSFVVMFSYEQTRVELQALALACATGIPTSTFKNCHQPAVLREYEVKPHQISFLSRLVFVNYVDADGDLRGQLDSGIIGIADHLKQLQTSRDANVGLVIVDYIGAIATINNMSSVEAERFVGSVGQEACLRIARPNGCPVWLIHQLSGEANQIALHGLRARSEQTSDSTRFDSRLNATFVMGRPNDANLLTVRCTVKENHTIRTLDRIASLRGDICRIEETAESYVVRRAARHQVSGDNAATSKRVMEIDCDIFI